MEKEIERESAEVGTFKGVSRCSHGVSGCFQMYREVFKVLEGVFRGVQGLSGCSRVFPDVHRGFQGVSRVVQRCTGVVRVFQSCLLYTSPSPRDS